MHKFTLGFLVLVLILSACGRAPAPKGEPTLETLAATINVTTPIDELDLIPNNKCSLREAIVSANENRDVGGCKAVGSYGSETINVSSGTYHLSRECLFDSQDCDDLNIHSSMTINGASAASTIIDASVLGTKYASRVMRIGPRTWGDPFNATVRLNRLTLREGHPDSFGGALVVDGTTELTDVILEDNTAPYAGAITFCRGSLTLTRVIVRNNNADEQGGGISRGCSGAGNPLVITQSIFSGNHAGTKGGAIHQDGGSTTITNSTFSGNRASDRGAGINSEGGVMDLINVTITGNNADGTGAGAGIGGGIVRGGGEFRLGNTIVAGNLAVSNPDCSGPFGTTGNNLIGIRTSACTGFSTTFGDLLGTATTPRDPLLDPLANNEPNPTHALRRGSPAIDRGRVSTCPATDQRGTSRPFDGDNDGIKVCDIGAFEYNTPFSADLRVNLDDSPGSVLTSGTYTYIMTVNNLGPDRAALAKAVLNVPSTATVLSTPSGCSASSKVVTCSLGTINSGASVSRTISVRAPSTVSSAGYVIAVATASSSTPDPSPTNRSVETTVITGPTADLVLDLGSSVSTVNIGSAFNYTLALTNNGPQAAQLVTMLLNLPTGLTVNSLDGCEHIAAQTIRCRATLINAGASFNKTIGVTANGPTGTITASASVSAAGPSDPVGSNNSDSVNVTVSLPATDMNVAIPAPTQNSNAPRNTDMTYQVRVRNVLGTPALAKNVVLTVAFPNTVSNIQVPAGCTLNNFVVACNIGIVSAEAVVSKNITVRLPNAAGNVTVSAAITLANPDPNTLNNQLTRAINVQ